MASVMSRFTSPVGVASLQRVAFDSMESTISAATTTHFTRSAPAALNIHRLDGTTLAPSTTRTSEIPPRTSVSYSTTLDIVHSQSRSLGMHIAPNVVVSRELLQSRTASWVHDDAGPRWIRGIDAAEPPSARPQLVENVGVVVSNSKTLCDCCAAARHIRELDRKMAADTSKSDAFEVMV